MKHRRLLGECIAEFLGTMVLILFGCGVVAMTMLFGSGVPGEVVRGGWTNITLGWGIGVTMGIYVAGRISGAHLNPAVTLAMAIYRGFPWRKVLPYSLSQTAGAFTGAALVFWNYRLAFLRADPLLEKTAGVFTTFPAFPNSPSVGFLDQVLGTALLLMLVFAIVEEHNIPSTDLWPVLIGLLVVGIGASFGALHGYAINPARDLGPRCLAALVGFRNNGLTDGSGVFWVPIVAPLLGGVIGGGLYEFGVHRFLHQSSHAEAEE